MDFVIIKIKEIGKEKSKNLTKMCDRMMWGSKAPNYDACGLFRASHSHNPTQYSHIVGYSSHFYAHIRPFGPGITGYEVKLKFDLLTPRIAPRFAISQS